MAAVVRQTCDSMLRFGLASSDQTKLEKRRGPQRRHLSRAAARHHRAGAGAGRQAARGRDRRTLRRQPHDRAACAGPTRGRRAGRAAAQPRRGGRNAELGRGARCLRRPPRTGSAWSSRGWPGRLTPEQIKRLQRPCRRGRARARHRRAAVDPARDRIPHPAGRDDRQSGADALRQRECVALRPDAGALQPAALLGMRGERASRHHRGAREAATRDARPR